MVIFETDECFENQDLQKPSDLADSQFSFECETCTKNANKRKVSKYSHTKSAKQNQRASKQIEYKF